MGVARTTRRRCGGTWVLLCVLLLGAVACVRGPQAVAAEHSVSTLEDYRQRVTESRREVEDYVAAGAEEGPGALVISVLTRLPAVEFVRVGDTEVRVDNSILWSLVARLDVSRDPARRLPIARDMASQLRSIERSLPEGDEMVPSDPQALARLLEHAQTQARSPITDMLGEIIDRIALAFERWQAQIAESRQASYLWSFMIGLLIISLFVLLAIAAWRIAVRVLRSTARRGPVVSEESPPHPPVIPVEAELPDDVVGFAESLAAEQRFAEAVRALFGGAARLLAEHGHVARTRTRTNNELLEAVRGAAAISGPLGALAASFERAYYGHVDPGPEGYRAALADYASLSKAAVPAEAGGAP